MNEELDRRFEEVNRRMDQGFEEVHRGMEELRQETRELRQETKELRRGVRKNGVMVEKLDGDIRLVAEGVVTNRQIMEGFIEESRREREEDRRLWRRLTDLHLRPLRPWRSRPGRPHGSARAGSRTSWNGTGARPPKSRGRQFRIDNMVVITPMLSYNRSSCRPRCYPGQRSSRP